MGKCSWREYAELILFPEDTHWEELENSVERAFKIAGENVKKHNFHTIHQYGNSKMVIAKLVNW